MAGGYYTPVTATGISSTAYNEYVRDQVVCQFATTAARDSLIVSPQEGMLCYTRDTDTFWFYNGAAWVNHERTGIVAYVSYTSFQTGISTITDISALSTTFTADSSRYYRFTVKGLLISTVANDIANVWLTNASNTGYNVDGVLCASTVYGLTSNLSSIVTGLSGSQTVKVRCERAAGSGAIAFGGASTHPAYLLVEDMGVM